MYKSSNDNFNLEGACRTCVRSSDCIACKIKNYIPSIKSIHSELYRTNERLFCAGDKLENLYVVKSGSFKTFITYQTGGEQILNFYTSGDLLGLDGLPSKQHTSTAVSLETSSVCAVPMYKLAEIYQQLLPQWLIEFAMNKLTKESKNTYLLGKKSAHTRIASFLLKLSENNKVLGCSDREFDLSMSRDDIGNYLGLASETVSRTFSDMRKKGCVKLDRRHVTIVDTQDLNVMAES